MLNRKRLVSRLSMMACGLVLSTTVAACGASDTVKIPDTTEVVKAPVEVPAWAQGEFPVEEAFFGHGEAPITGDEAAATEAARANAMENLRMEVKILSNTITTDHEEQVAELISKYPMSDMTSKMEGVEAAAVEKAEQTETFTDPDKSPPRRHVLVRLSVDSYLETLTADPDLPDEQKKRATDFRRTFTDNVLTNLARKP